jgi:UDP-N-acetylmuramate--alanine ligase
VLFQPHRYTRTRALLSEFATSFADADVLRVVDIYAASEAPIDGVSSHALVAAIRAAGHRDVEYAGSVAEAAARAVSEARPGDMVLTLGAGNITQATDLVLLQLKESSKLEGSSRG